MLDGASLGAARYSVLIRFYACGSHTEFAGMTEKAKTVVATAAEIAYRHTMGKRVLSQMTFFSFIENGPLDMIMGTIVISNAAVMFAALLLLSPISAGYP